jgi:FKBP-type peptidyl-prolyl cis-trans isomerase FklB
MPIASAKKNRARVALPIVTIFVGALFLTAVTARSQQSQAPTAPAQTSSSTKSTKPSRTSAAAKKAPSSAATATHSALTTDKQKDSYALGMNVGRGLVQQPVDIDVTTFMQGIRDALEKRKSQLTDDQIKAALAQLQSQVNTKAEAENHALGEADLKQGEEFLASNKTKPGVVTTPSGLQYKIITTGTGPKPTASDTVVCDYRGTLINGKEFDSSYRRGQPASFPVNGVIKGWTEALQMMPVGSKWELFIPPGLAYGSRGAGPDIGPNTTLIFEVELHSIKGK